MALLRFLFWLAAGVCLLIFAVSNRGPVWIGFWPFPSEIAVPLWAVFFAGIFLGLVTAGVVTGWIRLKGFVRRRQLARSEDALRRDVDRLAETAHRQAASDALGAVARTQTDS